MMSAYNSSMQYTIGTALERAREAEHLVEVLVGSHWITGMVVARDGMGVVLDNHGLEHCIIRLESITAVRVAAEAPMLNARDDGPPADRTSDGAVPMPGPRAPVA